MAAATRSTTTRRARGWAPVLLILCILIGGGAGGYYYLTHRAAVATVSVRRGSVVKAFYATGVVRPDYEYILKSKVQGALLGLEKREGARVYKGEVLARVDDKQLQYEVDRCTAELAEAGKQADDKAPQRLEILARLTEARQQTDLASDNLKRTQSSFQEKAANYSDLDSASRSHVQWANAVSALESQLATWKIASQRAVDVASANLRKTQSNLADAEVVSPIDGIILERYVENQEVVGINQKLLFVAREDDKLMKAAVDEEDITRTHIGQKVQMQLYAFQERNGASDGRILEGKVLEILPTANAANKTYEVKIQFVEAPAALRVGMTGELNFIEEESGKNEALIVPSSAVLDKKVYRAAGGAGARIADALGGGYEAVPVKLGVRTLDSVEILEGVHEGDVIVRDAKDVAPVKLPPAQQPVVPTRTGDLEHMAEK